MDFFDRLTFFLKSLRIFAADFCQKGPYNRKKQVIQKIEFNCIRL
jgi:hypothetical protein